MFCFQCQQTAHNTGCDGKVGVCGKKADTAVYQDELIGALIALANAAENGSSTEKTDMLILKGLFTTITNVNFNNVTIKQLTEEIHIERNRINSQKFDDYDMKKLWNDHEDIRSLKSLILFGIKGMAAYAYHAQALGKTDSEVTSFFYKALRAIGSQNDPEKLLGLVLETGNVNLKCMALLDAANTDAYGDPVPTEVPLTIEKGPFIVVSGHDLHDMKLLLEQTKDKGVNIYTHSEMLPAHYYPQLKKYKHLAGNYGNAWWKQKEEFESFNGPILFTSNCIVPPRANASYKDRIYITGACGLEGAHYIPERKDGKPKDFSALIAHAKQCQPPTAIESGTLIGGFAHAQVVALADKVVEAVKSGAIRKFFVMAGCDGRMKSREYYTEFAEKLPKDTVILTAGCAKYRYNKLALGDINGIPRVLDAGQCNDSYSLAVIALKLKEVFGLDDVNKLPIVYNIAWYEQKAVIVLLALLALGVKNIHLGPTLPAFLSPNVKNVLIEQFGIGGISTADEDIMKFLS